jgi:hypothetical protein
MVHSPVVARLFLLRNSVALLAAAGKLALDAAGICGLAK